MVWMYLLWSIIGQSPVVTDYVEKAEFYQSQGRYDSSEYYFEQSLALISDSSRNLEAQIKLDLGRLRLDMGLFDESTQLLYDALNYYEEKNDWAGIAKAIVFIGEVSLKQGDREKALNAVHRSLEVLSNLKAAPDSSLAYSLEGLVHMDKIAGLKSIDSDAIAVLEEMKKSHDKALEINQKYGDTLRMIGSLHYIASYHHVLKENEVARRLWQQVIDIADKTGALRAKCYAIRGIGGNYAWNNQCDVAVEYFKKAREIASSIGEAQVFSHVTDNLGTCYSLLGEFQEAYRYQKAYARISDSIARKKYNQTIADLEAKYETDKKEQQITILENEKRLREIELRNKNIAIASSVGGLLLFIGLGYAIQSQRNQNQKLIYERQLSELEQKALLLQMNPHFIFNSLNAIQGFIAEKNHVEARKYLSKYAKFMRLTLETSRTPIIPLVKEIELLTYYFEISEIRLERGLRFEISSDLDNEETGIPSMMIQPFAENAIEHGLLSENDIEGQVKVTFTKNSNGLLCTINDNGIGFGNAESKKGHTSTAMEVIQERLEIFQQKYSCEAHFEIQNTGQGTLVKLLLPIIPLP